MDERDLERPDEDEIVMFLERDQLVSGRQRPLPSATLGPGSHVALWILRVFVLIVGAMVIYTFFAKL